jgi:hypothetical protein
VGEHERIVGKLLAKTGYSIRFNELIEGDGPTVFAPRLQDGARRHRVEAQGLGLSFGTLVGLAQNEER